MYETEVHVKDYVRGYVIELDVHEREKDLEAHLYVLELQYIQNIESERRRVAQGLV